MQIPGYLLAFGLLCPGILTRQFEIGVGRYVGVSLVTPSVI